MTRPHATGAAGVGGRLGIVTLADSRYFPGVEMLWRSAQVDGPIEVACFDLGLGDAERERAARCEGLSILPMPASDDIGRIRARFEDAGPLAKPGKRVWPIWCCPFLVAASPFPRTLWIDADIVVLRGMSELARMVDTGPVFTPENFAPDATPNKPALYERMPIARRFDPRRPVVNAGVSGWDLARDREILESYMEPARRACIDAVVADSISWWDQGCLIWAIQRHGLEHRVLATNAFNLCVKHTRAARRAVPWDARGLAELRRLVPEASLVHWNGCPAPWLENG